MANMIRTTLLLAGLTGILLLIGGYFGGRGGMLIALIFSILMNFGTYWYSDKLVLKMYKARELTVAELRSSSAWWRSGRQRWPSHAQALYSR